MRCVSQWSLKQEDAWTGWIVEVTLSLREKTYFVRIVCMLNERIDGLGTPVARLSQRKEQKRNFDL